MMLRLFLAQCYNYSSTFASALPCKYIIATAQSLTLYKYTEITRPQSNMLKKLPKMLLEYSQNFYLLCSSSFPLCFNMNNIDVRILLIECSTRVFTIRAYVCFILSMNISAF